MKNILFYFILFLFFSTSYAQNSSGNWVEIDNNNGNEIFIDTVGLSKNTDDDIYIWAIEENDPPIVLEGIEGEIYKTKTLYLINKKLRKYSLAQIVYYDEDERLLKQFSYEINDTLLQYKYSYPIYSGSDVDYILAKSLEYIGNWNGK